MNLFAEGTREIRPTNADRGNLILHDAYGDFARYDADEEWRLNINICEPGERIYFGLRQNDEDVLMRIKDPQGNVVFAERNVPRDGDEGYIADYDEAFAGPEEVVGAAGYDAIEFVPADTGNYYIEFFLTNGTRREFSFFDITVVNAANVAIPGRVWSKTWTFSTGSFTNRFEGELYIYSDDGIVTQLEFNGMQPFVFVVSANPNGTQNTGDFFNDRRSVTGLQTFPQYRIFLNDPDENCFPSGSFGNITNPLTITGCGENKCINIEVDQDGFILMTLDLNGVAGYQENTEDVQIYSEVIVGNNCIPWDTRDNFGNLIGPNTTINIQVDYLNGITHLPLYDVEEHDNGYTVSLTRPAGGVPQLFWDDRNIPNGTIELNGANSPAHTWDYDQGNVNTINTWWYANILNETSSFNIEYVEVDADTRTPGGGLDNNDSTICSNSGGYQLSGSQSGATGAIWRTLGSGTFSDSLDLAGIYFPSAQDFAAGSVILTLNSFGTSCTDANDSLRINLIPGPTVNTGPGDTLCEDNPNITINASASNTSGVTWIGGNGIFIPNRTSTNVQYNPAAAEVSSGSVQLILSSDDDGVCPQEFDTVTFIFDPVPEVSVGADTSVCETTPNIQLAGTVLNAQGGVWSGGTGSFDPDSSDLNAQYIPSTTDISAGSIVLTLTTVGNGVCDAVTDQKTITFIEASTVSATPADIDACATADTLSISATTTGTPTVQWSGGNGQFLPSDTSLNIEYVIDLTDTVGGSVQLFVSTTGNDGCAVASDTVNINFTTPPEVVIDPPGTITVCANKPDFNASVNVTNSTGGLWIGNGGVFSPSDTSLEVTYTPSQAEIDGFLTAITYRAQGGAACAPVEASIDIIILPEPIAEAGGPDTICLNNPVIQLSGSATNGNVFYWTGGDGTYDDSTRLDATYTASDIEITNGLPIQLILHVNQDTTCNEVTDTLTIFFKDAPIVEAGPNQSICVNNSQIQLNGSISGATGATWSGGNGTFDDETILNSTYTPTSAEVSAGSITLYLTADQGLGVCNPVTDSLEVIFTPAPTVDAGSDISVCRNNIDINLNGAVTVSSGGIWSGGDNSVLPSSITLTNASYTPSDAERNSSGFELFLTSAGNGNCSPVTDTIFIEITDAPTIDNFNNDTACVNAPDISFNVTPNVASGVVWSGNGGVFTPDNLSNNITYSPSTSEINNLSYQLTATTTDNLNCNAVAATRTVTLLEAPVVNAGPSIVACQSDVNVPLNGSVVNAQGLTWTSLGTGTFSDPNVLNPVYFASSDDINIREVTLVATSTGSAPCVAVSDTTTIEFEDEPSVEAGPTQNVCSNQFPIQLDASGSIGTWTGGTGVFNPNTTVANAQYTPSQDEIDNGFVVLTYTSNLSGGQICPQESDDVRINLRNGPEAFAGNDTTICGNEAFQFNGSVLNATNGFWATTNGSGSFSPSQNDLNAIYTPHSTELDASITTTIQFVLSANGIGFCPTIFDTINVSFTPTPTVDAGADQTLCGTVNGISLTGSSSNTSGITWTGGNGGVFLDARSSNTVYAPSLVDLNQDSIIFTITTDASATCASVQDQVTIFIIDPPQVDAGPDFAICADSAFAPLTGSVIDATGGVWYTSGTGIFTPTPADTISNYVPSIDDIISGSVTLFLETTGNGVCDSVIDSLVLTITESPTVNAGPDTTVCADTDPIALSGTSNGVAGGVEWSSSGSGTFSDVNDTNATYLPSQEDIDNGVAVLTLSTILEGDCKPQQDQVLILITPAPTIEGSPDQLLCIDEDSVSISADVTIATGGVWSTLGSGSFESDSSLNTQYIISSGDTANQGVQLVISSTGNGICKTYMDTINISFQDLPQANAGIDFEICADSFLVELNGSTKDSVDAEWSTSGSGIFAPNSIVFNPRYQLSASDLQSTSIAFVLTTTENGVCSGDSDTLNMSILPPPVLSIGGDTTVCSNVDSIALGATIENATGGVWTTTGTGTFSPNDSTLNAFYIPSSFDRNSSNIIIGLTSTGNGLCNAVTETRTISITSAPEANAGPNITICEDSIGVFLDATVTNSSAVAWSSNGTGVFGPDTVLTDVTYYPSIDDRINGSVLLTLNVSGEGNCTATSDTMRVFITPAPIVDAGVSQRICADQDLFSLVGTVENAGGGLWSTAGTGNFSPSAVSLNTAYEFSNADRLQSSILFTLTSTNNGICRAVTDTVSITVLPEHDADAGSDQVICADADFIVLDGSVQNAAGGYWTSTGAGNISPDSTVLNGIYDIVDEDRVLDTIIFRLITSDTTNCSAVSDLMYVTVTPTPTVNAGSDISVCNGIDSIEVQGNVTIATGGIWSTPDGNGTFIDNESLSTYYLPDPSDQAGDQQITLLLESTGNGDCLAYSESIVITFTDVPFIDAGNDSSICNTDFPIQLNGSGAQAQWSGGLGGTFSPNTINLNASYDPSSADSAAGQVRLFLTTINTGTCTPGRDSVLFTFTDGPIVDAGVNQIACTNDSIIQLNGSLTNTAAALWTTTGNGVLNNPTSINASYILTESDKDFGQITFTLTSTDNGLCSAVSDETRITILEGPEVTVNADRTLCESTTEIDISGGVENASGGVWSGGSNSFLPTNTNLVTTYQVAASDITNGSVTLTLTSTGQANCPADSAEVTYTFVSETQANAGTDLEICTNIDTVSVRGTAINSRGVQWRSIGTGNYDPSPFNNIANYNASSSDLQEDSISLIFTAFSNSICPNASDTITLSILPEPQVNAGNDTSICEVLPSIVLNATALNTNAITWTTSGSGDFSPNDSTLNATYQASQSDLINGGVNIQLAGFSQANCFPALDFLSIEFVNEALVSVNAGIDIEICADVSEIALNGFISKDVNYAWTTSGDGSFSSIDESLNPVYVPGSQDTADGSVILRLTAFDESACGFISDSVTVNFTPIPSIVITDDVVICEDSAGIELSARFTVASGIQWSSSGTGQFSTSNIDSNVLYVPSIQDINNGLVNIAAITTGNGTCQSVSDIMEIEITPAPTVIAGNDIEACGVPAPLLINGSLTVATQSIWSTSGSGVFGDENVLSTTYTPTQADIDNGTVALTLTTVDHGNCRPVNDQILLTLSNAPEIDAGFTQTICEDGAINVSGSFVNAGGVFWVTRGSGSFADPNLASTTYSPSSEDADNGSVVLVINTIDDGACASIADSIVVNIQSIPELTLDLDVLCELDEGIELRGSYLYAPGILWSTNGSGAFSPSLTDTNVTYFPSLEDVNNGVVNIGIVSQNAPVCPIVSLESQLNILPIPVANAGADQFVCTNGMVNLSTEIENDVTYSWLANGIVVGTGPNLGVDVADTTDYVLVASRADGCDAVDTVRVNTFDLPDLNLDPLYCLYDTTVLEAQVSNLPSVPGIYQWYLNDIVIQNANGLNTVPNSAGTYSFFYAYESCEISEQTIVTNLPEISATNEVGCKNDLVVVETSLISNADYVWNINDSIISLTNTAEVFTNSDSILVEVVVTDQFGCIDDKRVKVFAIDSPILDLSDSAACQGETIVIDGTPLNVVDIDTARFGMSFLWTEDSLSIVRNASEIRVSQTGLYVLAVSVGQCTVSDSSNIAITPPPSSSLPEEIEFCELDQEFVLLDPESDTSFIYLWSPGSETTPTLEAEGGNYSVIITNPISNCSTTDEVFIEEICAPEVFVPNAFTPNGSGVDSRFRIFGHDFTNFKMTIYNRWGEVIFYTEDADDSWDGTYLGKLMPIGTYPWVIEYEGFEQFKGPYFKSGSVTIVR